MTTWQVKWPDLPPQKMEHVRFMLIDSYSDNSDRTAGRSSCKIYLPQENGNLRFILIDSYSESPDRPGCRSSWQI